MLTYRVKNLNIIIIDKSVNIIIIDKGVKIKVYTYYL